jgi:hypothetical protein
VGASGARVGHGQEGTYEESLIRGWILLAMSYHACTTVLFFGLWFENALVDFLFLFLVWNNSNIHLVT